ncbi:MAG: hypothetical protein GC151_07795 [Betaproteobacteria bacterium]|nr:hypothetical protein [Betaproteobacteria bacterium]
MASVTYGMSVQVSGGPQVSVTRSATVEAYEKVDVTVDPGGAGASAVTVDLQPGPAAQMRLMLIKSSLYGPELTLVASDGTTDSDEIALTEPQFFLGGAFVLFGGVDPTQLKLRNTHTAGDATKKASIEILVARDATP